MSSKPKDHRPKIVSFSSLLDGLNIAAKQDILWPCHAFNISIPQKKKNPLNIFEETVLKITDSGSSDTEKIAQLICLEKELIIFIQKRLNQLGLLTERFELSEGGRNLLSVWRSNSDENLEYTAGTVFVDLLSGKLLPFISMEQLNYKKISKINDNGRIDFLINPTNENFIVSARHIQPTNNSFWNTVPSSDDIIRAIREFKKKYKRYALLNHYIKQCLPMIPMAEAISLHENPELVYLHCEVLIQTGNPDLLVTDGCGFGFSENFANYLMSQEWQWVSNLKRKAIYDKAGDAESANTRPLKKIFRYKEISKRVVTTKKALQTIENLVVNSTHYESDYRKEIENGIKNLYAAIEWALRQVLAENPVSEWEQIFSNGNFKDNEKLLVSFAKKIGFAVSEHNRNLLQVKAGAIRQIDMGKVELQPVLALGIAGASSNTNHPVYHLAQNHSEFLNHVLRLKKYRDSIEHGNTENLHFDKKILEELIDTIVPMIITLEPGVADDLDDITISASQNDINQDRLRAIVALEKNLGTAFVASQNKNIKEQLIRSELILAQYDDDNALEIIKCYASAVQQALLEVINDHKIDDKSEQLREKAVQRIVDAGFFSSVTQVPKVLTTVAPHNVRHALEGVSTTLGAQLLAVFLSGSISELMKLQKLFPTFVDFIATLVRQRGHGNKQQFEVSRDDIEMLKHNVVKSIKVISEIF